MKNTLTKSEWTVMSALWEKPHTTISGIIGAMGGQMDWKYNTYVTYITRMCEKGLIGYRQLGRDKFYYPLVKQEECILAESKSILEKMNGKAAKALLVCMIKDGSLTPKDREELMALLGQLNREGE
jgi:BlaI family penicillinase repressor